MENLFSVLIPIHFKVYIRVTMQEIQQGAKNQIIEMLQIKSFKIQTSHSKPVQKMHKHVWFQYWVQNRRNINFSIFNGFGEKSE